MSATSTTPSAAGACWRCERRSWLLARLSGPLDYVCRDRSRLQGVLALPDAELIQAAGGRRKLELRTRYEAFADEWDAGTMSTENSVCRHRTLYPAALGDEGAPRMLYCSCNVRRLLQLTRKPVVAITGCGAPSDYGIEMARSLARGLAIGGGVTVATSAADGIPAAALEGAMAAGGSPLVIRGDGLRVRAPVRHRLLHRHVAAAGCVLSELPPDCPGRRWGAIAAERVLARLAVVTLVVEAADSDAAVASARMAQALGSTVAAVPGRVTSRLSSGANGLLADGARLIRCAGDVLELLPASEVSAIVPVQEATRACTLSARLRGVLDQVGAGRDRPDSVVVEGSDRADVLLALTELELMGLLVRGHGGRYLPSAADTPAVYPND